jgi:hypothetical protein
VEESTVVNEWIAKGEKRGEARGIAIGEARGKEIGGVEGLQAAIIRLGAKRFGLKLEGTETAVKAIQDHTRLKQIIDRILDATSWDDLLATT